MNIQAVLITDLGGCATSLYHKTHVVAESTNTRRRERRLSHDGRRGSMGQRGMYVYFILLLLSLLPGNWYVFTRTYDTTYHCQAGVTVGEPHPPLSPPRPRDRATLPADNTLTCLRRRNGRRRPTRRAGGAERCARGDDLLDPGWG